MLACVGRTKTQSRGLLNPALHSIPNATAEGMRLCTDCAQDKGGGLFEFQTPPPLQNPPKFSNPSFSNLRFWGKESAPKAPNFFFTLPEGVYFFTLCFYTQNIQNFVDNSKMFEKHRKFLAPDLTSGSDLG